jgi:glutathione S-transferase
MTGHVVTECAAICTYLAHGFPDRGLMAQDTAAFYRWMFFAAGPLEAGGRQCLLRVETRHAAGQGPPRLWQPRSVVRTLAGHLAEHDYIADGRFTAADVYVGSQVGWGLQLRHLPAQRHFAAYWNRMKDRPARVAAPTQRTMP